MRKRFWFFCFSLLFTSMLFEFETRADFIPVFWGEAIQNNSYLNIEINGSSVTLHQRIEMKLTKSLSDDYLYTFTTESSSGEFDESSLSIITPPSGLKDSIFDRGCKLEHLSEVALEDTLEIAFEYRYQYPDQNIGEILYKRSKATDWYKERWYYVGQIIDTSGCIDIVCNRVIEVEQKRGGLQWTTIGKGTHIVYQPYSNGMWNPTLKIIFSASGKVDTLEEKTCFEVIPEHRQYIPNLIKNEFITIEFTERGEDVFDCRLYGTIELDMEIADLFDPFYAWFPNDHTNAWVKLEGIYEHSYYGLRYGIDVLEVEPSVLGEQKGFYILIPELSDTSEYDGWKYTKASLIIEIDGVQSERSYDFILVSVPQEYSSVKFKIPQKFSFGHCFSPFEHEMEFQDEEFRVKKFYGRCMSTGIAHVEGSTSTFPEYFNLSQNCPNPFNQETIIRYTLPRDCAIKLSVYNLLGERVRTLVDEPQWADDYEVMWDGKNEQGENVASGVYFYRIEAKEFTESKKMVIVK